MITLNEIPKVGFLRLRQIIGDKKKGEQGIIPISASAWWKGVKENRYPQPVKTLGKHITAWRAEDIRALIESAGKEES